MGLAGDGFGQLDAAFEFANASEVIVELALVVGTELAVEAIGVVEHEIENALALGLAAAASFGRFRAARAEEALEYLARIDFFDDRRVIGFPGDIRRIGTTIAGIAAASLQAGFAAELERRKASEEAYLLGSDLIDRDAHVDVFAIGFLGVATGEIDGHGAGMIAWAVAVVARPILRQARKNQHVVFERLEFSQSRRQLGQRALGFGSPIGHVNAVGHIEAGHAAGGGGSAGHFPDTGNTAGQASSGTRRTFGSKG